MQRNESKPLPLFPLIATLFGLIVAFHLGNALLGKSLFRAAHLGTALEYAHTPINLLRPVIVGFNAAGTPTPQELPVWQATAGLVFKLTGSTWYGWANHISLLFFAAALWPFYQLAREYLGARIAGWGLAFFLAQPLIIVMAGEAATDGFCLVVTLWFLFFVDKMIRTGNAWWWVPAALFGALSAVSKLPFFMAVGLCSALLLAVKPTREWRPWILLAGTGAFAAFVFAGWTHYTDSVLAQAEFPFDELRVSHSPHIAFWYFGDLHSRLSPGLWIKGGWRFLHATLGSLPLVLLLISGLLQPGNRLPKVWLFATFLTTLVFTNLVLVHWHYYLMCCPAVALLCGATLTRWETFWASEMASRWLRFSLAGVALVLAGLEGTLAMKIAIDYDYFPQQMAGLMQQYTKPEDRLIVCSSGPFWGGEVLFRSGRQGLCVANFEKQPDIPVKGLSDILGSEADMRRLKSMGYNKLLLLSESPVRFAAQAINPGSQRKRFMYPKSISPKVDAWPVVYQSEDLLIKEIP